MTFREDAKDNLSAPRSAGTTSPSLYVQLRPATAGVRWSGLVGQVGDVVKL